MKLAMALIFSAWFGIPALTARGEPLRPFIEHTGGVPEKLVWQSEAGKNHDLWQSPDLGNWTHVNGFPRLGNGSAMEHAFTAGQRGFYQISSNPEGFAFIPAGKFQMGDSFGEGYSVELPVHTVYVSAFYLQTTEVNKAQWDAVAGWAAINGYDINNACVWAKASSHPVYYVTWHEAVKWCNARSQKEGLAPCYTVSGQVFKTGTGTPDCNFSASGYRLPTEAEWEKAARGGLSGKRFPWGDTITHSQANYHSSTGYSYDISPTGGFHPAYNDGIEPYTSPVGSFAPNGYGLYDMAGNLWEWCNDWHGGSYYNTSPGSNPTGPGSGSFRVGRGGCWYDAADACRSACRGGGYPDNDTHYLGFRPVRTASP